MISVWGKQDSMLMGTMYTSLILEKASCPATKAPTCPSREGLVCIASLCVGRWVARGRPWHKLLHAGLPAHGCCSQLKGNEDHICGCVQKRSSWSLLFLVKVVVITAAGLDLPFRLSIVYVTGVHG